MANIQPYIDQIQNAVYGEEVRSSIVNALTKVNDDNDSYADLKKEVIAAKDKVDEDVDAVQHVDSVGYTSEYVTSANRSAYPDSGLQNKYRYEYRGTIGQALTKVSTISN